jgi:hypothetical protein
MRHNARTLADRDLLRKGISLDQATDVLWTYSSPELYELLVLQLGWPPGRYGAFIADFLAKKERLGVDQWGGDGHGPLEVSAPAQDLVAREFPHFNPSPWGRFDWVRTLLLNITFAQPMAEE